MTVELAAEIETYAPRSLCALSLAERRRIIARSLDSLFRWYRERSQAKRTWNPDTSFEWRALTRIGDTRLLNIIEGYYAVEQFAPDYSAETISRNRDVYARSQFQMQWGSEEAKHADTLRNVLVYSKHRSDDWMFDYTETLRRVKWTPPFTDPIEQTLYTVLQERATQVNYINLAKLVRRGDPLFGGTAEPVIANVAVTLAADEAAHFNFFLEAARLYLYYLPEQTLQALVNVLHEFVMPASEIIPGYERFIADLYAANLFGPRIYGREVAVYCLAQLGVRSAKRIPPEPADHTALAVADWVQGAIDRDALFTAVDRLYARLLEYFSKHQLPAPAGLAQSAITWDGATAG
jgi:acyl-[acyl-carrier-protein] desaturase